MDLETEKFNTEFQLESIESLEKEIASLDLQFDLEEDIPREKVPSLKSLQEESNSTNNSHTNQEDNDKSSLVTPRQENNILLGDLVELNEDNILSPEKNVSKKQEKTNDVLLDLTPPHSPVGTPPKSKTESGFFNSGPPITSLDDEESQILEDTEFEQRTELKTELISPPPQARKKEQSTFEDIFLSPEESNLEILELKEENDNFGSSQLISVPSPQNTATFIKPPGQASTKLEELPEQTQITPSKPEQTIQNLEGTPKLEEKCCNRVDENKSFLHQELTLEEIREIKEEIKQELKQELKDELKEELLALKDKPSNSKSPGKTQSKTKQNFKPSKSSGELIDPSNSSGAQEKTSFSGPLSRHPRSKRLSMNFVLNSSGTLEPSLPNNPKAKRLSMNFGSPIDINLLKEALQNNPPPSLSSNNSASVSKAPFRSNESVSNESSSTEKAATHSTPSHDNNSLHPTNVARPRSRTSPSIEKSTPSTEKSENTPGLKSSTTAATKPSASETQLKGPGTTSKPTLISKKNVTSRIPISKTASNPISTEKPSTSKEKETEKLSLENTKEKSTEKTSPKINLKPMTKLNIPSKSKTLSSLLGKSKVTSEKEEANTEKPLTENNSREKTLISKPTSATKISRIQAPKATSAKSSFNGKPASTDDQESTLASEKQTPESGSDNNKPSEGEKKSANQEHATPDSAEKIHKLPSPSRIPRPPSSSFSTSGNSKPPSYIPKPGNSRIPSAPSSGKTSNIPKPKQTTK